MYFVVEKYLDILTGKHRKKVVSEKEQISKEQEQSQKDLSTVCDCESYCDKYKPQNPTVNLWTTKDEPTKGETKKKSTNLFGAILKLFDKKDSTNKKEKSEPIIEYDKPDEPIENNNLVNHNKPNEPIENNNLVNHNKPDEPEQPTKPEQPNEPVMPQRNDEPQQQIVEEKEKHEEHEEKDEMNTFQLLKVKNKYLY
jgi:hypothetical protein